MFNNSEYKYFKDTSGCIWRQPKKLTFKNMYNLYDIYSVIDENSQHKWHSLLFLDDTKLELKEITEEEANNMIHERSRRV